MSLSHNGFLWLIAIAVVSCWISPEAHSQKPNRERNRPGSKPGEVITPPDRSEFWRNTLEVGDKAPDFTLPVLDKKQSVADGDAKPVEKKIQLSELYKKKPVVLVFGSYTCSPFRRQLERIEELYKKHKNDAEFLFVYIREAHPDSVLTTIDKTGGEKLTKFIQPKDDKTRLNSATLCQRTVKLTMPMVVDKIDNKIGKMYAGWPNRMLIIGTDGKIAYASRPAPNGTDSRRLEEWLQDLQKR